MVRQSSIYAAPPKKTRACIPCHDRKVRCDSYKVGTPCTRCVSKNRTESCILSPRSASDTNKRKKKTDQVSHQRRKVPRDHTPENTRQSQRDCANADIGTYSLLDHPLAQSHAGTNDLQCEEIDPILAADFQSIIPTHQTTRDIPSSSAPAQRGHYSMTEDDAQIQTIYRMAEVDRTLSTPSSLTSNPSAGQQIIEYYSELNALAVLGESLGQRRRKRLVQIDLPGPPVTLSARERELSQLDPIDQKYIQDRRVYDLPPQKIRDIFLSLFFKYVYPYTPILDRIQFFDDYNNENCSTFLLYSIFANVAPYTPSDVLLAAGYTDVSFAQKEFFSRARILYDMGCEKGQLNLLQGSILLSSFQNSFAPDKDFRFWFINAIRMATQLGLHKQNLADEIDVRTHKLCRRIWWLLVQRDVLFSLSGFENMRRLSDEEFDVTELTIHDLEDEPMMSSLTSLLPPVTQLECHFFIENSRLARLGARFLQLFRTAKSLPVIISQARELLEAITTWRSSLPPELLIGRVGVWHSSNVWILLLHAMSYRLECVLCRTLRQRVRDSDPDTVSWANQQLLNSMFELETLLTRAMIYDVIQFCPPSLIVCTINLLAFQIEFALDTSCSPAQRLAAKAQIHAGISYFQDVGGKWINAKWALRVIEWVVKKAGFNMSDTTLSDHRASVGSVSSIPLQQSQTSAQNITYSEATGLPIDHFTGLPENWLQDMIDHFADVEPNDSLFGLFGA